MTRTTAVSMLDRVQEIREEEIAPRQDLLDELREEVQGQYDKPWEIPSDLEQRYSQLKEAIKNLRGEANTLEHYAEEWGGDDFVIRELTVGSVGLIQDDVAEASGVDFQGNGTPKQGFARQRTLEVALKDSPAGAPEPEDFPDAVGDWLFDVVNEFNTTGEVDLGNSSLRMEMISSAN